VLGGGHNGLVSAAYLAKSGLRVCVLERRHILGGASVTEELHPGFRYSRASYLAGLLRPQIIRELELERHGFRYLVRDPSSYTPTLLNGPHGGNALVLGSDEAANARSVAQFSKRDAEQLPCVPACAARSHTLGAGVSTRHKTETSLPRPAERRMREPGGRGARFLR